MSLLRDLDAFYREHRRYGDLDSGVESDHRLAVRAEHLLARVRVDEFAVILGLGHGLEEPGAHRLPAGEPGGPRWTPLFEPG